MIKKILGLITAALILVAAVIHVTIEMNRTVLPELTLANAEVLAENESNPWYLWLIYGLTQDETPKEVKCTWEHWYGIPGIFGHRESGSGKKIICEDNGEENCWSTECQAE